MLSLTPEHWLNDEIINFTFKMLQERDGKCHINYSFEINIKQPLFSDALCAKYAHRRPSIFFNTFFMAKLLDTNGNYNYDNIKRYAVTRFLFEMLNMIILP